MRFHFKLWFAQLLWNGGGNNAIYTKYLVFCSPSIHPNWWTRVSITAEYFAVLEYDEYDNTLLPPPILYKIREILFVIEWETVFLRFLFFLFQFLQMVWRSLNFVHDPSYQRHNKYCESVVNVHPSYQNVLVLKSHVKCMRIYKSIKNVLV